MVQNSPFLYLYSDDYASNKAGDIHNNSTNITTTSGKGSSIPNLCSPGKGYIYEIIQSQLLQIV